MAKFCIEQDDQGQFTAGPDTADQEAPAGGMAAEGGMPMGAEGQEDSGMSPVKDLEAALQVARDYFANPQAQTAKTPSQSDMWNRVQRDRALASQPGGPMMGTK